jgi:glycogen debranching enzyme
MTDRPAIRKVPSQTSTSLVNAGTVVTSDPGGGIEAGTYHGVYHRDLRLLSRYTLTVDGDVPNLLRAARRDATSMDAAMATSFSDHGDARGVLVRHRAVRDGVHDRYELHRLAAGPPMRVQVDLASDFAHLMAVKGATEVAYEQPLIPRGPGEYVAHGSDGSGVRVSVEGDAPEIVDGVLTWEVDPAVGDRWTVELTIVPDPAPTGHLGALVVRAPLRVHGSDHRWARAVDGAVADLASLRMEQDGTRFTAAGAPWFMALFGRDALLTAFSALPLGTDDVLDILEALAARQGTRHDARSLEQPGRILHELRTGASGVFGLDPGEPYYGTADATPLFVLVLAEAARWGADPARVAALLPAARRAVTWCVEHGDVDGDGFVEAVPDEHGIENQGWKDSGDSMVHADGSHASPPIALIEVQAYLHGALLGLAELEERAGEAAAAGPLRERAKELTARVQEAFWSERLGGLAMGLDAEKRPLEVASSNMGHALWGELLSPDVRGRVAARVTAPDLFTSWGIRTLGSDEVAYAPLTYHRGTIWPHDTAIVAYGLARAGADEALRRLADEVLALAEQTEYRLPELLGGTSREDLPAPVPYPVACNPQAWSAAAPLLLLRAVLGLEPDVPAGELRLAPALPAGHTIEVTGLRLGSHELRVRVGPDGVEVDGADAAGLRVVVRR